VLSCMTAKLTEPPPPGRSQVRVVAPVRVVRAAVAAVVVAVALLLRAVRALAMVGEEQGRGAWAAGLWLLFVSTWSRCMHPAAMLGRVLAGPGLHDAATCHGSGSYRLGCVSRT
jgi:hypothetical protein